MSKIKNVIKKRVANPASLIGVLDDLVYSMVLGVLIGEMKEVLKEEEQGLKQIKDDKEALKVGEKDIEKLETLIVDLEAVKIPATMNIKDTIRQRYMR